jgi:hypothetical protein
MSAPSSDLVRVDNACPCRRWTMRPLRREGGGWLCERRSQSHVCARMHGDIKHMLGGNASGEAISQRLKYHVTSSWNRRCIGKATFLR